ncbi:hypothetical protein Hanom_Chr15g01364501 [Helianthus anomalus]
MEICLTYVRKTKEIKEYGDPRFPKMVDILDRMIGLLNQMTKNIISQQMDPMCEECGGPLWYEECAIVARLEMRWGNREREQQNMRGHESIFGSSIYETRRLEILMDVRVSPPMERKGEDEEEVEQPPSEDKMSWENEFKEELDGLPVDEEVEEFDLEGDLA